MPERKYAYLEMNYCQSFMTVSKQGPVVIFTLSETWLNENVLDHEIQIPGFNIHRLDRSHKPGGGVCVYVKEQFKVQSLADISGIFPSGLHQL